MRKVFLAVLGIFAVIAILAFIGSLVGPTPSATNDPEAYLKAAATFLVKDLQSAREIAQTMNSINSGYVTLSEIRDTIDHAKGFHASIWVDTLMGRTPPSKYAALDQQIRTAERLRYNALGELLLYWDDQNMAHIDSGMKVFARSIALENDCLNKLDASILSSRPKNSPPH
ncbi:MAG: hypothetical protein ACLPYB_12475 [Desulfobaccales bacterium]